MKKKQKKVLIRIIITAVLLAGIIITEKVLEGAGVEIPKWIEYAVYAVPYLVIGYDILKKAGLGIIHGQIFDENFLMAIATAGAFGIGEMEEGVAVMLFYQIGELFQSIAVGKSRKNITALMDIRPDYANIESDGELVQVSPDEVKPGEVIVVKPGEKIPIDGVVIEGTSALDTSALTGESVPRNVGIDTEVISGCINMTGLLKIRTTKEFGESTVSKILDLVQNSGMKKSKSEDFITRFAKIYTPLVCIGAVLLALLPPLFNLLVMNADPEWLVWVNRALTFLVISCPCALVISIPLSFFGGIGGASSQGILVKGSSYLELLSKTKYVVFDKTGTMTEGVFKVTDVVVSDAFTGENASDELLYMAAMAESFSDHPISKSLKQAAIESGKELTASSVSDVEEISGHGVIASVSGKKVYAGNSKLMQKYGIVIPENVFEGKVGTIIHVAKDGIYSGSILISDVIKTNAKAAISGLKENGIDKTVMLTGDARRVADFVAAELGVDEVKSELLPADKVDEVEKLLDAKKAKEVLAFVGDGINDAPVLTRADIGIAMGAMGSDAAIEAADIVLMDDDPIKIPLAMKISRKTLGIVRQNIVFALFVKAACLVLGAIGFANMWWAIFADVGVMVLAVLNATRALMVKRV